MATYDSLSASDKAVVQATVNLIRSACGSVGRTFNTLEAIAADTNAINLLQSIDAGDTIPNQSGYNGSDDMTRSEIGAIWSDFVTMRTSHDTAANRAAWSKAVGVAHLLDSN